MYPSKQQIIRLYEKSQFILCMILTILRGHTQICMMLYVLATFTQFYDLWVRQVNFSRKMFNCILQKFFFNHFSRVLIRYKQLPHFKASIFSNTVKPRFQYHRGYSSIVCYENRRMSMALTYFFNERLLILCRFSRI